MISRWVCMPCFAMIPQTGGLVTAHGEQRPDALTVWCPWCGDKMDRAEAVMAPGEYAEAWGEPMPEDDAP